MSDRTKPGLEIDAEIDARIVAPGAGRMPVDRAYSTDIAAAMFLAGWMCDLKFNFKLWRNDDGAVISFEDPDGKYEFSGDSSEIPFLVSLAALEAFDARCE